MGYVKPPVGPVRGRLERAAINLMVVCCVLFVAALVPASLIARAVFWVLDRWDER